MSNPRHYPLVDGYLVGLLYKVTHKDSGRGYYGITTTPLSTRQEEHKKQSKFGPRPSGGLHEAIFIHGWEAFSWEVVGEFRFIKELLLAEKNAIRDYDSLAPNGMNLSSGGQFRLTRFTRIRFRNVVFDSVFAVADFYGIKHKTFLSRLKVARMKRIPTLDYAVDVDAKVSQVEKATQIGIPVTTIYGRQHRGESEMELYSPYLKWKPSPQYFEGKLYASKNEMSRSLNIFIYDMNKIVEAYKLGTYNPSMLKEAQERFRQSNTPTPPLKADRTLSVYGVTVSSKAELCRVVGLKPSTLNNRLEKMPIEDAIRKTEDEFEVLYELYHSDLLRKVLANNK